MNFKRISIDEFNNLSPTRDLGDYARKINIEIPEFDPFSFFGFEERSDAEWGLVDMLLTSSHPEDDYLCFWEKLPSRSVVFHLGDTLPPACPGLVVSNQAIALLPSRKVVGCMYPVLDQAKEKTIARLSSTNIPSSQKQVDIFFHGWDNHSRGYPERGDAVNQVLSWDDFSCDIELNSSYRGGLSFDAWVARATRSKICLVPPGIGLNSWRLTELMLAGCFCMLVKPVNQLRFDPPLRDRDQVAVVALNELRDACTYYTARPGLVDDIARRGQIYARSYGALSGWKSNIFNRVTALTKKSYFRKL